jgi:hypothetical protein
MDLVPTPDQASAGDDPLAGWLAEVEGRLTAIEARLANLESSLRPAVAEEVKAGTADLRRAMTELGRRLVTDLPHELARHRDAIVAELRPPPPPPPPPAPPPEFEEVPPGPAASQEGPIETDAPDGPEERRGPRRRRRHG